MRVVVKDTTPTIVSYPRVGAGGPALLAPSGVEVRYSTAAVAWQDEDTGWIAADADALAETVTATAEEGATALYVTSTDVVVGRRYLVVDVDAVFVVDVSAKAAGVVYLAEPLRRAVSASAVLTGWAVTYDLTSDGTATVGPAVVQWRATIGGVVVSWTDALRVARRLPVIPLTSSQLVQAYPEIKSLHARQDETLEQLIASAWEYEVLPRILRRGSHPEDIVNADVVRPLLASACMVHALKQSRQSTPEVVERWQADFRDRLDETRARIDWHVETQDMASIPLEPSEAQRAGRFRRMGR